MPSVRPSCTAAFLVAVTAFGTTMAQAAEPRSPSGLCGTLQASVGPIDYRNANRHLLQDVETNHFTPQVESLRAGVSGPIGADLDYTLAVFPNHPRALTTMARLGAMQRTSKPTGAKYPVECYFDRAARFVPDDAMVRVLYGIYLAKQNRPDEAREQLGLAEKFSDDNPQIVYNIGLGYVELQDYDRAVLFAKKAREMGIALPGLRERIQRAGKWTD